MKTTDTSEKGLEGLTFAAMTGQAAGAAIAGHPMHDPGAPHGGTGWIAGDARDYDREYAVDLEQLRAFLLATQKDAARALGLDKAGPTRSKFLARLQGEIAKRGAIDFSIVQRQALTPVHAPDKSNAQYAPRITDHASRPTFDA